MSEQITIQEAKQLKEDSEKRIAEIVHGFEERTGYVVREIDLERHQIVGYATLNEEFGRTSVKLITEVK